MSFDVDAACAAALARLAASTEARIEAFRRASRAQYVFAMRSVGQCARQLRERTAREIRNADR